MSARYGPAADHAAMVHAIEKVYRRATDEQKGAGARWYPTAGRIIDGIAEWSGVEPHRVAAAMAALSPRNPWAWNVQDCAAFAYASAHDLPMPRATTFGANQRRAWAFLTGETDWNGAAPKVRSFVRNMTGDLYAVTVDIWAVRVVDPDRAPSKGITLAEYARITKAYQWAAYRHGITPSAMQATCWLVARTGDRRSAHAIPCKRGTLPIVRTLLGAA